MGELLILLAFLSGIGFGAWLVERPRRVKPETIEDTYTTSETGVWR